MAQTEQKIQYVRENWHYILSLYQEKKYAELLSEAAYILREHLAMVITKKPYIYSFKKEETFNKTILYANLYVGVWHISLKLTDRGEVEYEVTK